MTLGHKWKMTLGRELWTLNGIEMTLGHKWKIDSRSGTLGSKWKRNDFG